MKAEAMFKAKISEFSRIYQSEGKINPNISLIAHTILFAACVIVEGIRNEMEDETK